MVHTRGQSSLKVLQGNESDSRGAPWTPTSHRHRRLVKNGEPVLSPTPISVISPYLDMVVYQTKPTPGHKSQGTPPHSSSPTTDHMNSSQIPRASEFKEPDQDMDSVKFPNKDTGFSHKPPRKLLQMSGLETSVSIPRALVFLHKLSSLAQPEWLHKRLTILPREHLGEEGDVLGRGQSATLKGFQAKQIKTSGARQMTSTNVFIIKAS
ncbi:uncharacterized protein [Henckelia pumila]|uniref:uncharacterized protein isoform X2 n=1 Tax=Henckelia pumila TaxID=405737 RepID=UPI003C6DFB17